MVRHVVMFRLKEELDTPTKWRVVQDFKFGIKNLPKHISCIAHIEVGMNMNPDEKWDICLVGEFSTLEDVREYAAHPLHQAVAERLKPYVVERSCVDYEY